MSWSGRNVIARTPIAISVLVALAMVLAIGEGVSPARAQTQPTAPASTRGTLTPGSETVPAPTAAPVATEADDTDGMFPIWAWLMVDGIVLALLARHLRNYRAQQRKDAS